jgi:hypothetical protein
VWTGLDWWRSWPSGTVRSFVLATGETLVTCGSVTGRAARTRGPLPVVARVLGPGRVG